MKQKHVEHDLSKTSTKRQILFIYCFLFIFAVPTSYILFINFFGILELAISTTCTFYKIDTLALHSMKIVLNIFTYNHRIFFLRC